MPSLHALAAALVAAVAPTAPAPAAADVADVATLVARADEAWSRRDDPAAEAAIAASLDEAERRSPADFQVLWRQARLWQWRAEDPALPDERKSVLGKKAWDYGDRASAANPTRVEGWYYAMAGIGNYSLGISVVRALAQGMEGKFKERLATAERIDAGYEGGGIPTAWGRFHFELPWPKYDAKESERRLRQALGMNPRSVRVMVYLGDLCAEEKRKGEARDWWTRAASAEPGAYDAPEERRWKAIAAARLQPAR